MDHLWAGLVVLVVNLNGPAIYAINSWAKAFLETQKVGLVHYSPDSGYDFCWSVVRYAKIMEGQLYSETYSSKIVGIQN